MAHGGYHGRQHPINRGVIVEHNGKRQSIGSHAVDAGVPLALVLQRLRAGMTIARALSYKQKPAGLAHLTGEQLQIAQRAGVTFDHINQRLSSGWPIAEAISVPPGMKGKFNRIRQQRRNAAFGN